MANQPTSSDIPPTTPTQKLRSRSASPCANDIQLCTVRLTHHHRPTHHIPALRAGITSTLQPLTSPRRRLPEIHTGDHGGADPKISPAVHCHDQGVLGSDSYEPAVHTSRPRYTTTTKYHATERDNTHPTTALLRRPNAQHLCHLLLCH